MCVYIYICICMYIYIYGSGFTQAGQAAKQHKRPSSTALAWHLDDIVGNLDGARGDYGHGGRHEVAGGRVDVARQRLRLDRLIDQKKYKGRCVCVQERV